MDMQKCCIKNVRVRINLCMVTMNLWESGNTVETIVSIQKKNLLGNFVATFSFSLSETGKGKGRLFFYRKQVSFIACRICYLRTAAFIHSLLDVKGIGLIENVRLGMGKPNIIYIKNFAIATD